MIRQQRCVADTWMMLLECSKNTNSDDRLPSIWGPVFLTDLSWGLLWLLFFRECVPPHLHWVVGQSCICRLQQTVGFCRTEATSYSFMFPQYISSWLAGGVHWIKFVTEQTVVPMAKEPAWGLDTSKRGLRVSPDPQPCAIPTTPQDGPLPLSMFCVKTDRLQYPEI